jgi:hypothetical protein
MQVYMLAINTPFFEQNAAYFLCELALVQHISLADVLLKFQALGEQIPFLGP